MEGQKLNKTFETRKVVFCADPPRASGASMTEQQLARKGGKALLRKLSIDVGTLGIEPGPAACEAGVIPLHHVILMLLPEAGVQAFTAREGQLCRQRTGNAAQAQQ